VLHSIVKLSSVKIKSLDQIKVEKDQGDVIKDSDNNEVMSQCVYMVVLALYGSLLLLYKHVTGSTIIPQA